MRSVKDSLTVGADMDLKQNDFETIKDLRHRGEITLDQAHVMMVRARRVLLVTSSIPADVRRALNTALKSGELARMKKEGRKPEAYYHPTFSHLARRERAAHESGIAAALAGVVARPGGLDA